MTNHVHPTALVSRHADLGDNISIGPYSIIHDHVRIGSDSKIDAFCELGYPTPLAKDEMLEFGRATTIRSHSVFYAGSSFGEGLVTGHRVSVRERTRAGKGFQIGTLADIQGHCNIGHYVRTQSSVTIGQKSHIGNFVWLFPGVILTNDPNPPSDELIGVTLEDYVVVAVNATLLPGVTIGRSSFVAAHSLVGQSMAPNSLISGNPARRICNASDLRLKSDPSARAYPWPTRFTRGYPSTIVEVWGSGELDVEFLDESARAEVLQPIKAK